ncbi:MAG: DciA family protein [Patescibacteria group bacterium]
MSFQPLQGLLPNVARHTGITEQIMIAQALTRAHRVIVEHLGESAGSKLQPAYIQNKTLFIATLEHPLAWEVGLHQADIVKGVNAESPYPLIQRIKVIS